MQVIDGEEYLTVEEACRRLNVKPATLYTYVSRGVLSSYKQGMKRKRLYRSADIDALLELQPSRRTNRVPEIPAAESWIGDH